MAQCVHFCFRFVILFLPLLNGRKIRCLLLILRESCHVRSKRFIKCLLFCFQHTHFLCELFFQCFIFSVFQCLGVNRDIVSVNPACFQIFQMESMNFMLSICIHQPTVQERLRLYTNRSACDFCVLVIVDAICVQ